MNSLTSKDYENIGKKINEEIRGFNYQVNPKLPTGRPGRKLKEYREFRLFSINKNQNNSKELQARFDDILTRLGASEVKFNEIAINSSVFSGFSCNILNEKFEFVISREDADSGSITERIALEDVRRIFNINSGQESNLISSMRAANPDFAKSEIISAAPRTGSTLRSSADLDKSGAIIGDIVITDAANNKWYVSIKDASGGRLANIGVGRDFILPGPEKTINLNSKTASILSNLGVNLYEVQKGFDKISNIDRVRISTLKK